MAALTLTLIGRDRPGLVGALSARVADAGGNWLEGRMARLAGQFAGILLVEVPDAAADRLMDSLRALEAEGLKVTAERGVDGATGAAPAAPAAPGHVLALELVGHDRPGIVRDIATALARRGVNIEDLATEVAAASFSGEPLFRATARLRVPAGVATADVRDLLEALAHELMVDIELEEADTP